MSHTIAGLFSTLKPDPWRKKTGFSADIGDANESIFSAQPDECVKILNGWLASKNQPCLFGRAAAKLGLVSYCILTESDLESSDDEIKSKIQTARTSWTREAFHGSKSAFVILAVSPRIAYALPDDAVKQIATRLCSFYLREEIKENAVHLDEIFLEMPGLRETTWKWKTGINYFSSQGDLRWWHDHRIPGGMAYSVNSVGHMVKSAILAKSMREMEKKLKAPEEGWDASAIESLERALGFAMMTIANAANTDSGKATELLALPEDRTQLPVAKCPYQLPPELVDKNFCEYVGHYHTDYTIPSEYFLPDIARPKSLGTHRLDFTYLFHKDIENPAFETMAEGQQIRSATFEGTVDTPKVLQSKIPTFREEVVRIDDQIRLREALQG